jgi:hypothetical protein
MCSNWPASNSMRSWSGSLTSCASISANAPNPCACLPRYDRNGNTKIKVVTFASVTGSRAALPLRRI